MYLPSFLKIVFARPVRIPETMVASCFVSQGREYCPKTDDIATEDDDRFGEPDEYSPPLWRLLGGGTCRDLV
jgi:hypothetical protein